MERLIEGRFMAAVFAVESSVLLLSWNIISCGVVS